VFPELSLIKYHSISKESTSIEQAPFLVKKFCACQTQTLLFLLSLRILRNAAGRFLVCCGVRIIKPFFSSLSPAFESERGDAYYKELRGLVQHFNLSKYSLGQREIMHRAPIIYN
jgi:hypothetical protein